MLALVFVSNVIYMGYTVRNSVRESRHLKAIAMKKKAWEEAQAAKRATAESKAQTRSRDGRLSFYATATEQVLENRRGL